MSKTEISQQSKSGIFVSLGGMAMMRKFKISALTLMELIIVVIILGILIGIAIPQYTKAMERSIDREAETNISLVQAAQKIYRQTNTVYYGSGGVVNLDDINTNLGLDLNANNFDYVIVSADATDFVARATRNGGIFRGHYWEIDLDNSVAECWDGTSSCP
ncbi:MAG: hypothetical protein ABH954_04890 [Candidatus Omnitrophota bacterium]